MAYVCLAVILIALGSVVAIRWSERLKTPSPGDPTTPPADPGKPSTPPAPPVPVPTTPTKPGKNVSWKYCPCCAHKLWLGGFNGQMKLFCKSCGFIHWDNPKPVAITVVPSKSGKLLVIKRKHAPKAGLHALPGGYVEKNELPEAAARREVKEETGLDVEIDRLLCMLMPPGVNEILMFFLAKPTCGDPVPGSDALEAEFFCPGAIPADIAFDTHRQVIDAWKKS